MDSFTIVARWKDSRYCNLTMEHTDHGFEWVFTARGEDWVLVTRQTGCIMGNLGVVCRHLREYLHIPHHIDFVVQETE